MEIFGQWAFVCLKEASSISSVYVSELCLLKLWIDKLTDDLEQVHAEETAFLPSGSLLDP